MNPAQEIIPDAAWYVMDFGHVFNQEIFVCDREAHPCGRIFSIPFSVVLFQGSYLTNSAWRCSLLVIDESIEWYNRSIAWYKHAT